MSIGLKFMTDRKWTDQTPRQPGFKFTVHL